jgi:hypothetical protein
MQSTLRTHILFLEDSLQQLRDSLTVQKPTPAERGRTQALISIAATALDHYKHALDLEHMLHHLSTTVAGQARSDGPSAR